MDEQMCSVCRKRFRPISEGQTLCSSECARRAGAADELARIQDELSRRLWMATEGGKT